MSVTHYYHIYLPTVVESLSQAKISNLAPNAELNHKGPWIIRNSILLFKNYRTYINSGIIAVIVGKRTGKDGWMGKIRKIRIR